VLADENGWTEEDSNLCKHAKRELELAGLFDEDSDYGGMIGNAAYEIVKTFARQGHSGWSAEMTADIVVRLMAYKPLTPLSSDPDEWIDQSELSGTPLWQNRRNPSAFSTDGGATWYFVGEDSPWESRRSGSACCGAMMRVESSADGTSYGVCTVCGRPADGNA
jgi:hypothetical protein